jgi:hypothetical protein
LILSVVQFFRQKMVRSRQAAKAKRHF